LEREWTAVMAQSNQERKLLLSAEIAALNAYLPRYQDLRGRERLLFRGYVFVEFGYLNESTLFNLRGGRGPIMFDGRIAVMPTGAIDHLRSREDKFGYINFNERFEAGQALIVVDGPYKNQVVLYRGMDAAQRELALFSLLGREVVKAFDRDELAALPVEKLN
jgi:transcription antitermination factor NusG